MSFLKAPTKKCTTRGCDNLRDISKSGTVNPYCLKHRKECNERNRVWKKKNRAKLRVSEKAWHEKNPGYKKAYRAARAIKINHLKSAPCMDCKGIFPPIVMDFDHVRGEKAHNVSHMFLHRESSWEAILEEVAKCELVCANCHRIRTANRHHDKGLKNVASSL